MKRISFFLVVLLALCFGQGIAATSVLLDGYETVPATPGGHLDSVLAGSVVKFHIKFSNLSDSGYNFSNGWTIYSPSVPPATWTDSATGGNFHGGNLGPIGIDTTGLLSKSQLPSTYALRTFSGTPTPAFRADGITPDTVAFSGAGNDTGLGLPPQFVGRVFTILIKTKVADSGKVICIDSVMRFYPTNVWKWSVLYVGHPGSGYNPGSGTAIPTWSGAKCVTLWNPPHLPPDFTACPTTITASHCGTLTTTVAATGHDGATITYALISGPGAVNPATGVWTASGLATGNYTVIIAANDSQGSSSTCTFNVATTNVPPSITCPAAAVTITVGDTKTQNVVSSDDCDVLSFTLGDTTGLGIAGAIAVNPATGAVTFTPSAGPAAVAIPVVVSDGQGGTATCNVLWNVITGAPFKIVIDKVHDAFQGQYYDVNLTLTTADTSAAAGLGGFDLLVAYDNSALSFQKAFEGTIYAECGWEYFTYRFGANGNCSGGCPSGLVRVVGIAETNNGANHPNCDIAVIPTTLAKLRFLVSNNRTYECMYIPIRFFWVDCTDNTLSNATGSILYVSDKVFDFDNANPINNNTFGFPTYLGAQAECLTSTQKAEVQKGVDFQNGGIDIVCADSIDARGDINLNGLPNEIADAVMFTQYFIKGLAAFPQTGAGVQGAIAASDVNADGIPLSVGDLVYLIRVIVGDAAPYDKVAATTVTLSHENGIYSIDEEMGAAHFVVAGNAVPKLLANNMTMISNYDVNSNTTSILVYPAFESLNRFQTFSGDFLQVSGNLVSADFGTPSGAVAKVVELPKAFGLSQNYPNPFNPTTTISFALPKASDYTLSIYNVAGQKVTEFTGNGVGSVEIEWNANGLASGVYFYKLEAGSFTATKKAVLLK